MICLAFQEQFGAAPLRAHLDDALRAPHRFDDSKALVDLVRQRLLDVDVLARFHRVDDHAGVPVVRRGDDHGVDRFVVEQLAVVVERLGAGGSFFEAGLQVGLVDIADGGHLGAELFELADQILAAAARADDACADAVVRALNADLGGCGK